jgi:hypothetical protein
MSHKDPSTTCCEQLVVRVEMPAANNIKGGQCQDLEMGL